MCDAKGEINVPIALGAFRDNLCVKYRIRSFVFPPLLPPPPQQINTIYKKCPGVCFSPTVHWLEAVLATPGVVLVPVHLVHSWFPVAAL